MTTSPGIYEIFLKNGTSIVLNNVDMIVNAVDRELMEINFKRTVDGDVVSFLNIGEIIAIVKRASIKKSWWSR